MKTSMDQLRYYSANLAENAEKFNPARSYYLYVKSISTCFTTTIAEAESEGYGFEEIINEINVPRNIYSQSPFVKRLQDWPKGYPGDFETVEYICNCKNNAQPHSLEYYIEEYSLRSDIAQQHRNKVAIQSNYLINAIREKKDASILIAGCGSAADVRNIQHKIANDPFQIVFNDMDKDAIEFSKASLISQIIEKSRFENMNILKLVVNEIKNQEKYDLVLFGGVFDYLQDRTIIFLLENIYKEMLNPGGKIVFTNIKSGNPFRTWIEYFGNWKLIERSRCDCMRLCEKSGILKENILLFYESTGLTQIVEIVK